MAILYGDLFGWRQMSIAVIVFLSLCLSALAQDLLMLTFRRASSDNFITLTCRDSSAIVITDASYFLNGSRVDTMSEFQRTQDGMGITVTMTRDFEGTYSCGNLDARSNNLTFIAYPDSTLISGPNPVPAITGERVQLNCPISPGALLQQYFVSWDKSGSIIARTTSTSPTPEFTDGRYDLNRSSLSLIIDSVRLDDASDTYHCALSVVDPMTDLEHTYSIVKMTNVSLVVYAPPSIVIRYPPTLRNTTTIEGQSASFECTARGYPPPEIIWQVNEVELLTSDPNIQIISTQSQDGYYNITTSRMEVISIGNRMSGKLKCIARSDGTDRELPDDERVVQVVVFVEPSIVIRSSMLKNTTTIEGQSVSFNCTATGYPRPEIIWQLNDIQVSLSDPKFQIISTAWQDGYYNVSSSHLEVLSARNPASGKVTCIARTLVSINGPQLSDDEQQVFYDVLGTFDLRVDVTQKGDVIFDVILPKALVSPIRLLMDFTNLDNPSQRKRQMSKTTYLNNNEILYREGATNIPYMNFDVSVGLTSAGNVGPLVPSTTGYAQNQPTVFAECQLRTVDVIAIATGTSISVVVVVLIIGVITAIILITCLRLKHNRKIKELEIEHNRKIKELEIDEIEDKRKLDTIDNTIDYYKALLNDQSTPRELRLGLLDKIQELVQNLKQQQAARKEERKTTVQSNRGDVPQQRVSGDGPSDTAGGPPPPPSYEASQARESEFDEAVDDFFNNIMHMEMCKNCHHSERHEHGGNGSSTNKNADSQTEVAATSTTKF